MKCLSYVTFFCLLHTTKRFAHSLFWSLKSESILTVIEIIKAIAREGVAKPLTGSLHIQFTLCLAAFASLLRCWMFDTETCCGPQTLFQYVTSLMKQGYHEESERQRHLAVSPRERPDKRSTALWVAVRPSASHNLAPFCRFPHRNVMQYILYLLSPFYRAAVPARWCLKLNHRTEK